MTSYIETTEFLIQINYTIEFKIDKESVDLYLNTIDPDFPMLEKEREMNMETFNHEKVFGELSLDSISIHSKILHPSKAYTYFDFELSRNIQRRLNELEFQARNHDEKFTVIANEYYS